jgi:Mg-chelatase subunit ChlD
MKSKRRMRSAAIACWLCGCNVIGDTAATPDQQPDTGAVSRGTAGDDTREPSDGGQAVAPVSSQDEPAAEGRAGNGGGVPAAGSGHRREADPDEAAGAPAADDPMSAADSAAPAAPAICTKLPNKTLSLRRAGPPVIWLVVDGSGSMADPLEPGLTRWDALHDALFGPSSLIAELESEVRWGMMIYDGTLPGAAALALPDGGPATGTPPTECVRLSRVDPKLANGAGLLSAYPALAPGGSTPTHHALQAILDATAMPAAPIADAVGGDLVVLATDGAPNDFCGTTEGSFAPLPVDGRVIELVEALDARGTQTYVLSLAPQDQVLQAHLTEVARAGNTGRPPVAAKNASELRDAVRALRGPALGCEFWLDGEVALGMQCQIQVALAGKPLSCSGDDGFTFPDARTLRLTGPACDAYRASAQAELRVDFPCDVFEPNP